MQSRVRQPGLLKRAMQNDASIIKVSGIPTISEVNSIFPAEISVPICSILSQLMPADELLPAPSVTVPAESVDRFREILDSKVYSQYSSVHKELEFAGSESHKVLADIRNKGSELLKTGKDILCRPQCMFWTQYLLFVEYGHHS